MKNVPDIAPEVRGLLEEIVADPRSMIRLAPRRALRTWFDTGETVRASDITRTKAERHLIDVHREELADLLCEASWISYWKAPMWTNRPTGPNGKLYHPTELEPSWRVRAEPELHAPYHRPSDLDLLRQCIGGIGPRQGLALGRASLALVPRDLTRFHIAYSVPWSNPRLAIALLSRFARRARPFTTRRAALLSLAARTCSLGLLPEARDLYRETVQLDPRSFCAWVCAFNLSCVTGDNASALVEAQELAGIAEVDNPQHIEVRTNLVEWIRTRPDRERETASSTARRLYGRIPDLAADICRSYES